MHWPEAACDACTDEVKGAWLEAVGGDADTESEMDISVDEQLSNE